jgi:hypothetical protein
VQENGHVWRLIAAELRGRSPAAVKNYYYSFMRRVSRAEAGKAPRKRRTGPQPPVDIQEYAFTGITEREEAKSAKDAGSAQRRKGRSGRKHRNRWMWSKSRNESDFDSELDNEDDYDEDSTTSPEEFPARRTSTRTLERHRRHHESEEGDELPLRASGNGEQSSGQPDLVSPKAVRRRGGERSNPPFSSPRLAAAAEELANLSASLQTHVDAVKEEISGQDVEQWPRDGTQVETTLRSPTSNFRVYGAGSAVEPTKETSPDAEHGVHSRSTRMSTRPSKRRRMEAPGEGEIDRERERKAQPEDPLDSARLGGPEGYFPGYNLVPVTSRSMQQFMQKSSGGPVQFNPAMATLSPQQMHASLASSSMSPVPMFIQNPTGFPVQAYAVPMMWPPQMTGGRESGSGAPTSPAPGWMLWGPPVPVPARKTEGLDDGDQRTARSGSQYPPIPGLLPVSGPDSRSSESELMPLSFASGAPFVQAMRSGTPGHPEFFQSGGAQPHRLFHPGAFPVAESEHQQRPPSASIYFDKGDITPRKPEASATEKDSADILIQMHDQSGAVIPANAVESQTSSPGGLIHLSTPTKNLGSGRQSSQSFITQTAEPFPGHEAGSHHDSPVHVSDSAPQEPHDVAAM